MSTVVNKVINLLRVSESIIYYISMEITPTANYQQNTSIFEVILQEYSSHELEMELLEIKELPQVCQNDRFESEEKVEETSHLWLTIHEEPEECLIELQVEMKDQQMSSQIKKVQISRQQQELKLKHLIQSTQTKSIKRNHLEDQYENSFCKTSKSLSPKKTKKIDKKPSFRLISEDV